VTDSKIQEKYHHLDVVYNTHIFDIFLHLIIINDNSLTQVVNKTTRKDKTLDLILTNYPATVNKVETLPPIADHDIVYIECITSSNNID
jgi:hypothetical protein